MNEQPKSKIGLLPLMLELYKESYPTLPEEQRPFIDRVADTLAGFGDVFCAPVCTSSAEIRAAVKDFEAADTDGIVIIFIAYAASIAALNPLLETQLPLLLFSTAPKSSMGEGMKSIDITFNHGVHGYMDLANVLKRSSRPYSFVSGTVDDSVAHEEIAMWARAAAVKKKLRQARIGLAGYTFDGMGDFGVDTTRLNTVLGPEVKHISLSQLAEAIAAVGTDKIAAEAVRDSERFVVDTDIDRDILDESNRIYFGFADIINRMQLNAVTMHFQGILENPVIRTVPFLAISKLQEHGLAYAGEGDLLGATANLMLRYLIGETIFTETFCPDFDGGRIVMGHMGESNPAMGTQTALKRKQFRFGKAVDPVVADVTMRPGPATVINLGIVENAEFQLIGYRGSICEKVRDAGDIDMPYFHFKQDMPLPDFLTAYGRAGGTHHIAMTYGDRTRDVRCLAELLNIKYVELS